MNASGLQGLRRSVGAAREVLREAPNGVARGGPTARALAVYAGLRPFPSRGTFARVDPIPSKTRVASLVIGALLACARPNVPAPATLVAPGVAARRAPTARLIAIDDARGLAVAALASGDAIVLGEVHPADRHPVIFVSRVTADGGFRWVRRFERREVARLPGGRPPALLRMDGADRIFVAALAATRLARRDEPLQPWAAIGPTPCQQVHRPVVFALDDDGGVRWVHDFPSLGPTPVDAAPMAIAPDESGGVYVAMVHLLGSAIAHINADGSLDFWRELTAAPTTFAPPCSNPGWRLDSAVVPLLVRTGDGGVLAGGYATVALAIDGHTLEGERRFWLSLAPTGQARWLRETAELPLDADEITAHYRAGDDQRIVTFDAGNAARAGTVFELSREIAEVSAFAAVDPRWMLVALNHFHHGVHRVGLQRFEITTIGVPGQSIAVVASVGGGRIDQGAVFRALGRRAEEGGRVWLHDLAVTSGGEILAMGGFTQALELDGERLETPPLVRPCRPGRAGDEVSRPPGCVQAEDRAALFLARLPPFGR